MDSNGAICSPQSHVFGGKQIVCHEFWILEDKEFKPVRRAKASSLSG